MDIRKFQQPAPRYTSYPTAPEWVEMDDAVYEQCLKQAQEKVSSFSLYVHIPFCKSMCLYCGCSVILNRKEAKEIEYVDYLCKEIDLVVSLIGTKQKVVQLHFGGGTPTQLSMRDFSRLFEKISNSFSLEEAKEIAIEIDPRTVYEDQGVKLQFLYQLGFNRISFGVQDTNEKVQEAVKRRQTLEMTRSTYFLARKIGFKGINMDLIYGLPFQTEVTFKKTIEDILEMRPDRIALFSYAHVPWLKPHQKAMKFLPEATEKFHLYSEARKRLIESGYLAIGMDHFALKEDEMAACFREKKLTRNFQGYSTLYSEEMIGLGVTAIGCVSNTYHQNFKDLSSYYKALDQNRLPTHKGKILSQDDLIRRWTIHTLMCRFELNKHAFFLKFHQAFDDYFFKEKEKIEHLEYEGLIKNLKDMIVVTSDGELLIRIVVMAFDAYLSNVFRKPKFSQSI